MSSTSTLRLRPSRLSEISPNATWKHCLAKCHLERERLDLARSQLKTIEVYFNHEQQMKISQKLLPNFKVEFSKLHPLTPQQFIYPEHHTYHLYQEYRQRKKSKKIYREEKKKERNEELIKDSSKSVFEILSDLRISQLNRKKEVEERSSVYVSEVIEDEDEDEMKIEVEFQGEAHQEFIPSSHHAQQLFELQQQEYQLQLLQQQYLLAEQQRQYQAQQEHEYQLRLLQHQQHEEYQRQLYLQQLQLQQFQAQQAQQIQPPQPLPQTQPSQQIRTGNRSRSNARSDGSNPTAAPSTPMAWVVAAAAKISSMQSTPKESACPDVEMADVFCPMVLEDDRMEIEVETQEDDKMVIDSLEVSKVDTDCVMMEVYESDESDSDEMME
ncbi:hypothetical protein DFH28DRAFT_1018552 [Melampsora americana]|nr:hypothetical protein DFH28DRAFT_1018552 [Melampsora americana]